MTTFLDGFGLWWSSFVMDLFTAPVGKTPVWMSPIDPMLSSVERPLSGTQPAESVLLASIDNMFATLERSQLKPPPSAVSFV